MCICGEGARRGVGRGGCRVEIVVSWAFWKFVL